MNERKVKTEKGLVNKLRKIRDRMNKDMENITFEEMKKFLKTIKQTPPQQTI